LDDFFPVVIFTKPPGALLIYDTSHWCDEGAVTQISVIVPSFNQGRFIEETLQSVLLQGYPELQLVVMDGGSNDDSVSVLQKYDHHLEAWKPGSVKETVARPTPSIKVLSTLRARL
jgi:GT2 family glycosyltransferase